MGCEGERKGRGTEGGEVREVKGAPLTQNPASASGSYARPNRGIRSPSALK